MCLFKRGEQDNTCNHEECKNYYTVNKKICMFNNFQQSQGSMFAKGKRSNAIPIINLQDPEFLNLISKRVKTENIGNFFVICFIDF